MSANSLPRREFLAGLVASSSLGVCAGADGGRAPLLRLGVVSDLHIMIPETCRMFEQALTYFKARRVDAVVVPGDLTDWGLKSGLGYVKATWDKVMGGTRAVPLFITGNHDFDGWWYGDMTMEMHANGYDEAEALTKLGMKACWEEAFKEEWAPVRLRHVRGFDVLSAEWGHEREVPAWLAVNGASLRGKKPFFYVQHSPVSAMKEVQAAFADYPNCIALTGHIHRTFNYERNLRQDGLTEISVPSLSCQTPPWGHENGDDTRRGESTLAMPLIPDRLVLRGGQGYVISLFADEMVVERRDIARDAEGVAPWRVPLPMTEGNRPYESKVRERSVGVPAFPVGATLETFTRNTENRQGKWTIVMVCTFPSATVADGTRVWDYEIRAVPKDGSEPLVKRFLSPAYARMADCEPERQRFWFDVANLPQDKDYVIEVRARNCFGKCSERLVSKIWHGKPGLAYAVRNAVAN